MEEPKMTKDKTNIEEILRDLHKNNVVNRYVEVEENGKKYSAFAYIEMKIKDQVQAEKEAYLDEFGAWLSVDWVGSAIIAFNEKKQKEQREHE